MLRMTRSDLLLARSKTDAYSRRRRGYALIAATDYMAAKIAGNEGYHSERGSAANLDNPVDFNAAMSGFWTDWLLCID